MAYSIIFLDPRVLMNQLDTWRGVIDHPSRFERWGLKHLTELLNRVDNARVVLIDPCKGANPVPSYEKLKSDYQDCGLGKYIIGKIDDPHAIANVGRLVAGWLCRNQDSPKPIEIHSFVIFTREPTIQIFTRQPSICHRNRTIEVQGVSLFHTDVDYAYELLTKPLEKDEIPAKEYVPIPPRSLSSSGCNML